MGSSPSRTILWSAEARGQGAREHGTHADHASASWLPAAESRTSQIRCIRKVRDHVVPPGHAYFQDALDLTPPGHVGEDFPFLSREPSLVILLTMARAPVCSGRAATRRDAPRSMGTARKVDSVPQQRHGGPPGDDSSCQPQLDSRLLARRGGETIRLRERAIAMNQQRSVIAAVWFRARKPKAK